MTQFDTDTDLEPSPEPDPDFDFDIDSYLSACGFPPKVEAQPKPIDRQPDGEPSPEPVEEHKPIPPGLMEV